MGIVGQPLPLPLETIVRDAASAPISGVAVNFSISSVPANAQGQSLSVPSQTTGPDGKTSTILTLGSIPLDYEVQAAASASTVTFQACGKLANDDFEQFDSRWGNDTYDNTTSTIGVEGCAVSSLATLNNFYRSTVSSAIPQFNPGTLNSGLAGLGLLGYSQGGVVNWEGLNTLSGNNIRFVELTNVDANNLLGDVARSADADLARGRPVVMRVRRLKNNGTFGTHFVLAVGRCRGEYLIADPGSGTRSTFDPKDSLINN